MKCDTWSWVRSDSIELNMFLELKKLTTNVDAEMESVSCFALNMLYIMHTWLY